MAGSSPDIRSRTIYVAGSKRVQQLYELLCVPQVMARCYMVHLAMIHSRKNVVNGPPQSRGFEQKYAPSSSSPQMPEMSYISSRETSTGDTEPSHFVEQRGAPHRESRSSTMRTSNNPVGFPQSSQNVFALGSRER